MLVSLAWNTSKGRWLWSKRALSHRDPPPPRLLQRHVWARVVGISTFWGAGEGSEEAGRKGACGSVQSFLPLGDEPPRTATPSCHGGRGLATSPRWPLAGGRWVPSAAATLRARSRDPRALKPSDSQQIDLRRSLYYLFQNYEKFIVIYCFGFRKRYFLPVIIYLWEIRTCSTWNPENHFQRLTLRHTG